MMQKPKSPITCVCGCILYKFILYSLYLAQFLAQAVSFRVREKEKGGRKEALSILIIKCILIDICNYFIKVFRSCVLNYFANVETKILWNLFLIYFDFFFFFAFLYCLFFWFFIFSRRIIALQYCIAFYQTSTWVNLWLIHVDVWYTLVSVEFLHLCGKSHMFIVRNHNCLITGKVDLPGRAQNWEPKQALLVSSWGEVLAVAIQRPLEQLGTQCETDPQISKICIYQQVTRIGYWGGSRQRLFYDCWWQRRSDAGRYNEGFFQEIQP